MEGDEDKFGAEEYLMTLDENQVAFEKMLAAFKSSDEDIRRLVASLDSSNADVARLLEQSESSAEEIQRSLERSDSWDELLAALSSGPELETLLRELSADAVDISNAFDPVDFANFDESQTEVLTPPDPNATASDAAIWMQREVEQSGRLYQERAAYEISRRFGDRFLYTNRNGNPAISREVLWEFLVRTRKSVVWERTERFWRPRRMGDPANARQV